MALTRFLAAALLLSGSVLLALGAEAAPAAPQPTGSAGYFILAGACHGDVQTHFVPEVSGSVTHYHSGSNCRPIAVQEQPTRNVDCHRDVQLHPVAGVGTVYHSHTSRSCRVILAEQPQARDCHDDVRLHFVPGHGEIYHAHRGSTCQAVVYERSPGAARSDCLTIGPVTVCPPR